MLELLRFLLFARRVSPKRNELSPQQQEAQTVIEISKNFPSMLRLPEVNPKDPFDPFSLGFPGKDLLDVLIREQAAETIMAEKNTSAEARQIVKGYFERSLALYCAILESPKQEQSLRNMADIMLQTYKQIGTINDGISYEDNSQRIETVRQYAIGKCQKYAREYHALAQPLAHR